MTIDVFPARFIRIATTVNQIEKQIEGLAHVGAAAISRETIFFTTFRSTTNLCTVFDTSVSRALSIERSQHSRRYTYVPIDSFDVWDPVACVVVMVQ